MGSGKAEAVISYPADRIQQIVVAHLITKQLHNLENQISKFTRSGSLKKRGIIKRKRGKFGRHRGAILYYRMVHCLVYLPQFIYSLILTGYKIHLRQRSIELGRSSPLENTDSLTQYWSSEMKALLEKLYLKNERR